MYMEFYIIEEEHLYFIFQNGFQWFKLHKIFKFLNFIYLFFIQFLYLFTNNYSNIQSETVTHLTYLKLEIECMHYDWWFYFIAILYIFLEGRWKNIFSSVLLFSFSFAYEFNTTIISLIGTIFMNFIVHSSSFKNYFLCLLEIFNNLINNLINI